MLQEIRQTFKEENYTYKTGYMIEIESAIDKIKKSLRNNINEENREEIEFLLKRL